MHTDLSPRLSAVFLVTILAAASTARSQTELLRNIANPVLCQNSALLK